MRIRAFQRLVMLLVIAIVGAGAVARAASISGSITNGTNGKPSAGDTVTLIDVQAGMSEAGSTSTDARGHYSIESPGMGVYLIRVNHQGGTYFIAAPQNGESGDVTVYDVAAKVNGVSIDADMLLVEAAASMLRVQERYMVRNTSLPPTAQFSSNTFEIVLPEGAVLDGAAATRPGGLGTNTRLVPVGPAGHYAFNVPIQPNQGEKETVFQVQYHLTYDGKRTFTPHLQMPADNLVVYVPRSMDFGSAQGVAFQSTQEDPRVKTYVAKNVHPGQAVSFTISGEGQMPRDPQGNGMDGSGMTAAGVNNKPGGGLGAPIATPDPITKYKWWMLGGMLLLLVAGAGYLLRNRGPLPFAVAGTAGQVNDVALESNPLRTLVHPNIPADQVGLPVRGGSHGALLNLIKEEMFNIESEKLSGELSTTEYDEVKVGLQALLKRLLKAKEIVDAAHIR